MDEIGRRLAQMAERLGNIEAQVAVLSEKAGLPYAPPSAAAPPEVVELIRQGKRVEAITKYRELTGAGIEDARNFVTGL